MNCPYCGDPVQTRHSFCTVCGSDLKEALENKPSVVTTLKSAGSRMKQTLNKPIGKSVVDSGVEVSTVTALPSAESAAASDRSAIVPDFMRQYI